MPFEPCFEPYVVVDKNAVPMYDERFRGYGMNKVNARACFTTHCIDDDSLHRRRKCDAAVS